MGCITYPYRLGVPKARRNQTQRKELLHRALGVVSTTPKALCRPLFRGNPGAQRHPSPIALHTALTLAKCCFSVVFQH